MDDKYVVISLGIVAALALGIVALMIFSRTATQISTSPIRMTPEDYFGGNYGQ